MNQLDDMTHMEMFFSSNKEGKLNKSRINLSTLNINSLPQKHLPISNNNTSTSSSDNSIINKLDTIDGSVTSKISNYNMTRRTKSRKTLSIW